MRLLVGSMVVVMSSLTSAERGSAAEASGIDRIFTAPPATLSAQEISMLQARASDFAQLARYRADDERLAQNPAVVPRIVFFGDSITEDWITKDWITKDWISHSRIPPSADREVPRWCLTAAVSMTILTIRPRLRSADQHRLPHCLLAWLAT